MNNFTATHSDLALLSRLVAILVGLSACVGVAAIAAPAAPLAADSVYQLPIQLTDQNGRKVALSAWRGKPLVISMFYTSCEFVCPRIIEGIKRSEMKVTADGYAKVPVLLVSFDADRDDVPTLKAAALERGLDPTVWTLARAETREVRKLAALLKIQYRRLPSGEFNHSSVLILLDAEGRIVGRSNIIGEADPQFVKLMESVMR